MLRAALVLFASWCPLVAQSPQPAPAPRPTIVIEGQVVDLRGEPVAAARVEVVTTQQAAPPLAQTVCDGEGCFKLARVPKLTTLVVRVHSQGRCDVEAYPWGTDPLRIVVHDAAQLRGVVRNHAGAGVAGVLVRASSDGRALSRATTDATTDAEGRFTLTAPLGFVRFVAVVPGEGLAEVCTRVQGDGELVLASGAKPTTSLRIVVEGVPAEARNRLRVMLLPYDNGSLVEFPPPWESPRFAQDGTLEMQLVPDLEYSVEPFISGFAISPDVLTAKQGRGPHVLKFTAIPAGTTSLHCPARVRDPAGKAVAGLRLGLRTNGAVVAETTSDADGMLGFQSPFSAGTAVTVQSLDDRFVLDQTKTQGMYGQTDPRFLPLHEWRVDPANVLDLRVVPACSVCGRVLRDDGSPAAFIAVNLEEPDVPGVSPVMAYGSTDRNGNYAFVRQHHADHAVRVTVAGRCGAAISEDLKMTEPGTSIRVPGLTLGRPAMVEGTAVDAQGKPAPGVHVWLRDWDFARGQQKSGSIEEVITDRQGRYRFVGVPPGGAWLEVLVAVERVEHPNGRAVEPFAVEDGKTYTFELRLPKPR